MRIKIVIILLAASLPSCNNRLIKPPGDASLKIVNTSTVPQKALIIFANGSPATAIWDPATLTFSQGPNLTGNAGSTVYGFAIEAGALTGNFLVVHGATTSVINLKTLDITAGPLTLAPPAFSAHSVRITSGPDIGKQYIVRGTNSTATEIFDPLTMLFTLGPTLAGGQAKVGTYSFVISQGANQGKIMTVHGNLQSNTSLYDPVTDITVGGPSLPSVLISAYGNHFKLASGPYRDSEALIHPGRPYYVFDAIGNAFVSSTSTTSADNIGAYNVSILAGPHIGKQLIICGNNPIFEIFDPETFSVSATGPTPMVATFSAHAIQITGGPRNGQTLHIVGGSSLQTFYYDPISNAFSQGPDLPLGANLGAFSLPLP